MSTFVLPTNVREDLERATQILIDAGVEEIYLFGSYADGTFTVNSDIDVAVTGIDKSEFFALYGKLLSSLDHNIDLVALDYETDFSNLLKRSGNLIRIHS